MAMKRAGLEGEFDMGKVLAVLTSRSRAVMEARREECRLITQHQTRTADDGSQSAPEGDPSNKTLAMAIDGAGGISNDDDAELPDHPGDAETSRRWEELLRLGTETDAGVRDGLAWRQRVLHGEHARGSGGAKPSLAGDAAATTGEGRAAGRRRDDGSGQRPLVPKGLELLPYMRVPLRRAAPRDALGGLCSAAAVSAAGGGVGDMKAEGDSCANAGSDQGGEGTARVGGRRELSIAAVVPDEISHEIQEYVPWIAGAERVGTVGDGDGLGG
ncbi:unnamed protein product, partial [Sphacelaria rigidula]